MFGRVGEDSCEFGNGGAWREGTYARILTGK
jgi:hypothetical protein